MEVKRALLFGAALWTAIFFEVSVLMFGFRLSGGAYYITHYVLLGVLSGIIGVLYFNGKNAEKGMKEGAKAGVVFLATGVVLDTVITVPLFVKDYAFFFGVPMLLGYFELVAIFAIVGFVKAKKS